jgi:hypothetical protein
MYKARSKNVDEILRKPNAELDAPNNIFQIEYSYVGIMKNVDNIMAIWTISQKNSSIPTIMTIKLTHLKKNMFGRVVLIDLLHPRFSLMFHKRNEKSSFSFSKLRKFVIIHERIRYLHIVK